MEQLQIPITLTVAQINQILNVLGKQPYNEVSDVIRAIKQQGDHAVDDAQRRMMAALHTPPADKGD